jgi:tRNA (guanine37-N1)-methyltransferase
MDVACVRVPREQGEATRRALADAGLLDHDHEITHEDGTLFIPVTDPDTAASVVDADDGDHADVAVVFRDLPTRETQRLPDDILGFEPSYERLGEIVILDEDDPDRAREIADALLESDIPVGTVVNRASKVKGDLRVRDWDVLVGETTEAVHREYGCAFLVDIAAVYFSPRLATERHRVVEQVDADERVFDMFAGVGPFAVPMAKRGATVVGCDLNPVAVEYLRENAERNGVADRVTAVAGDVREVATDWTDWADRLVMNLPHSADEFLDTAVALAGDECVLHYYDIQHEDDPFGPGERAIRQAVADAGGAYGVEVLTRHEVRSYAPHEVNVCLDVALSR